MPWICPCPACDHPIRPRPNQRGQWVRCPLCQHRLQIPAVIADADAAPSQPVLAIEASSPAAGSSALAGSASGFWRGLVAGVGFVVLAALLVIGVRGIWPARSPMIPLNEIPDSNRGFAWPSRPPQEGGQRDKQPEQARDVIDSSECSEHPVGMKVQPPVARVEMLPPVTQLPSFLAMVTARRTGHLLLSNSQSELRLYRQKDFGLLSQVILQGSAYALALDESTGRLYAAVSKQMVLRVDHLKGREMPPADVHVYDVSDLLKEKMIQTARLEPIKQHPIGASISSLVLSKDGKQLICISESGREAKIHRINLAEKTEPQIVPLRVGPAQAISLAPSGKRVFVLANGKLTAHDPTTWEEQGRVTVGLNLFSPLAVDDDHVLLLERQASWQVVVVDVIHRKALARWEMVGLEGRPSMAYSAEKQRFYIVGSGVLYGQVWELDCAGDKLSKPVLTRHIQATRERLLRGQLYLSDEATYILLSNGVVLRGA
ncbi:MAG: hypothetical protein SNJ75_02065 [Gemmataceae bacterium]